MIAPLAIVQPAAVDVMRIIRVLEELETSGNWDHAGGALQFTVRTWKEETNLPYSLARMRQAAEDVAQERLEKMRRTCLRLGVEPSVELLVGAWHHGLFGAMRRVKDGHISDYMKRGANLYRDGSFGA